MAVADYAPKAPEQGTDTHPITFLNKKETVPLETRKKSLFHVLAEFMAGEKDEQIASATRNLVPNIEVKYSSRPSPIPIPDEYLSHLLLVAPALSPNTASHEPVKPTLLRLPSPPPVSAPHATWQSLRGYQGR